MPKRQRGPDAVTKSSQEKRHKGKQVPGQVSSFSDPSDLQALRSFLGEPVPAPPVAQPKAKRKKPKKGSDVGAQSTTSDAATTSKQLALKAASKASDVPRLKPKRPKQPTHVDGILFQDELYLKDPVSGRVFSSTRDKRGDLVPVGLWDDDTKSVHFKPTSELIEYEVEEAPSHAIAEEAAAPRARAVMPAELAFEADPDDHCETPLEAYEHIKPLLLHLSSLLDKPPAKLQIYDPYFCAGSVARHLEQIGFPNVYNKNEDFYEVIANDAVPQHDVLVTNPPYSQDHMEKLLKFCAGHGKPWFLLIPAYVHSKPYYGELLAGGRDDAPVKPFYVVPKKRYNYWSPKGTQRNNPKVRKDGRTSPFVTFWHVNAGLLNVNMLKWWHDKGYKKSPRVRAFNNIKSLPDFTNDVPDSGRRQKKVHLKQRPR